MRPVRNLALIVFELAIFTALIVATRCANYQDVFVAGNVYFVDADCYARMTRVQIVNAKPGMIVRHHAFENFRLQNCAMLRHALRKLNGQIT